jgi:hypothetical protein
VTALQMESTALDVDAWNARICQNLKVKDGKVSRRSWIATLKRLEGLNLLLLEVVIVRGLDVARSTVNAMEMDISAILLVSVMDAQIYLSFKRSWIRSLIINWVLI